jgi:Pyruvate/2-oxoacid:ferredoxin oxidoreductase delta subunit
MKSVTMMAQVDDSNCKACRTCERVCPVLAIKVEHKKAVVDPDRCRGCANCEQRCPEYAVVMVKRDQPLRVGVDVNTVNYAEVVALCAKAGLHPEEHICYCIGTRADEVAAAIIKGARTPEEVSLTTGARTGVHRTYIAAPGGGGMRLDTAEGRLAVVRPDGHGVGPAGGRQTEVHIAGLLL